MMLLGLKLIPVTGGLGFNAYNGGKYGKDRVEFLEGIAIDIKA